MPKFMRPTLLGKLHGAVLQRIASEPACRSVPTVLKKPSDKIAVVDWAVEVGCFSGKESPMYS